MDVGLKQQQGVTALVPIGLVRVVERARAPVDPHPRGRSTGVPYAVAQRTRGAGDDVKMHVPEIATRCSAWGESLLRCLNRSVPLTPTAAAPWSRARGR